LQKETSLERARTMQRNFVAWYLNGSRGGEMKDAALTAFVSPDEEDWRFSLVKMDYKFEKTKSGRMKVKEEFTRARRWSFLVGSNEKSHTAQSRLVNILANDEQAPILKEIENAFDIETVTKEFFLKYRELFLHTKEELDSVVNNDPKIKADFEAKGVDTVNFAKKLLGQIIFLYFLQKKGWFGVGRDDDWGMGSKHFLRALFDKKHSDYKNFYNDILEPLFYEALRADRSHVDGYYSRFDCKIPFLNGGLFDPIGNYDWVHTDIIIPDKLFSNTIKTNEGDTGTGILDVFDRYNFTVKEDEPLEKEVAIDPELLGKVYEKFNAIRPDNYDEFKAALKSGKTGEENMFNKKFGVYYTPREIVHYMCQQSLVNYLATELVGADCNPPVSKEDIETLIHSGEQVSENEVTVEAKGRETKDYSYKLPESIRQNAELIDQKLADITVCDPAVGSGAFPVGMMSEIIRTRNVLSTFIQDNTRTPYDFKHRCIEHSLYGVDIDPGAVEIAKLRLWLSLVVDEEDIKNIKPLPNLDYRIVCGNSLLGYPYIPMGIDKIEKLKEQFFAETNSTRKHELRGKIDDTICSLYKNTEKSLGYKVTMDFKINFSEVFHEKNGFDVVIANPPYIGEKGHKDIFREIRKSNLKEYYIDKMDIFYFFFHLALDISKDQSNIAFITTNYYITATGAKKLRNDFKQRTIIKNLINFNELKIFESAQGQHNMITILKKEKCEELTALNCITKRKGFTTPYILHQILRRIDVETQYFEIPQKELYDGEDNYIRLSRYDEGSNDLTKIILAKIKTTNNCLERFCNVNKGVYTGSETLTKANKVKYSLSNHKIGEGIFVLKITEMYALNLTESEMKIIKPFFKNSDIAKYYTSPINSLNLINLVYTERPDLDDKPNIKKHLSRFKTLLSDRPQTGTLHSALNNGYWYVLSTSRKVNMDGPKIIAPYRTKINAFGYNEVPWYAGSDVYYITEKDNTISLKYVLSILNSKLCYFWLYYKGKKKGEILELTGKPIQEIPIKKVTEKEQQLFINIVDDILSITKDDYYIKSPKKQALVETLEDKIDQLVYKLYNLTDEEIKIVEGKEKS
ncbi:MAG: Eco57I restriction-modification methylase domain-containing protein, partial [Bacteroidales bacterium]|nr:Eco57I restriction-modification methylase domain-containing protein [Bacteroidales bacterium]